jgi:hypothetical protein
MTEFIKGDLVCYALITNDFDDPKAVGHFVGFCPGPRWVKIKTLDGKVRIWLKDHVHNVDADQQEGNHAPPREKGIKGPEMKEARRAFEIHNQRPDTSAFPSQHEKST